MFGNIRETAEAAREAPGRLAELENTIGHGAAVIALGLLAVAIALVIAGSR
jgi:hypothetical protein